MFASSLRGARRRKRRTSRRRSTLESLERRLALDAAAAVTLVADVATTPEDQPVEINVLDNDVGQQLEVTGVDNVVNGTATINADGTITFTPDADFHGLATFDYTAENLFGAEASASVAVAVTPVNDAPLAGHDRATLDAEGTATIDVLANDTDVDGDALAITQIAGTAVVDAEGDPLPVDVDGGTVVLNADGTLTFTPNVDFTGRTAFEYTVEDAEGETATATVVVTSEAFVNAAPVAENDVIEAVEDGDPVTIDVLGNDEDPDGDPLTITEIDGAGAAVGAEVEVEGGVAVLNADGTITFTPEADFSGDATFTYTVSDGADEASATVTVSVVAGNDPPEAVPDEATVEAGAGVEIDVLANDSDADGDELTVTHIDGAEIAVGQEVEVEGGTVVLNEEGTLTFTADEDFRGEASFEYTVSDGQNEATATVTVDVTGEVDPGNPLHNPDLPTDVDGDGRTNVRDLLMVVRALRELGFGALPEDADPGEVGMVDVNDDGLLTVADLVAVARSMRNGLGGGDDGPGNSANAPGHNRGDDGSGNSANAPGHNFSVPGLGNNGNGVGNGNGNGNGNGDGRGRGRR
jgi:hypothetical protein